MNKLSNEQRVRVVACLVEGNSLRSTVRMTGVHRTTIQKLLVELGTACDDYQNDTLLNLPCRRIQCDEIWSFVGCKKCNLTNENRGSGWGDVWTWTAIDPETKLVPPWFVGERSQAAAYAFIDDLRARVGSGIQITTDGFKEYRFAIAGAFGNDVHYARQIKSFVSTSEAAGRYSPGRVRGVETVVVRGAPDPAHISTSHAERQNLTMRMSMRRFTRLTNGFSKKVENHKAAVALHFMHYNFCRIHQTLRVTPAMAAGISDHVWEIAELVGLLDRAESRAA